MSRLLCRPVQLLRTTHASRLAAALVDAVQEGTRPLILLAAVYGYPGNLPRTSELLEELTEAIGKFRGSYATFGDLNQVLSLEEGHLASLAMTGAVRFPGRRLSGELAPD